MFRTEVLLNKENVMEFLCGLTLDSCIFLTCFEFSHSLLNFLANNIGALFLGIIAWVHFCNHHIILLSAVIFSSNMMKGTD